MSAASDACRRRDGTVNRFFFNFLDSHASPSPHPTAGVRTSDVTINPSLRIRLFIPSTTSAVPSKLPLIVYFHGGGFAYCSAFSAPFDAVCRRIASAVPAVIVSVNYRLSPEHRHPSQYDDGVAALRFIADGGLQEMDPYIDMSSCFLVGDSAGANIAHNVAVQWTAAGNRKLQLRGLVSIQPWFGGEERTDAETRLAGAPLVCVERTDWLWKAFLPEGVDRDHEAANVFGPRGPATLPAGFPEVMVVVGGYDPLQDWQRRYYEGLKERGVEASLVEFKDGIHAFYIFPELPDSGQLVEELKRFVEKLRRSPEE